MKINLENFIGKRVSLFGAKDSRLTLIKQDNNSDTEKWICRCDCGNKISVKRSDLIRKDNKGTRSCGCMHKEISNKFVKMHINDLTNKRFGKLTALKRSDKKNKKTGDTFWWCECDCGNVLEVKTNDLLQNRVHSCGCLISYGEYQVEQLLQENNIIYQKEFSFEDCRGRTGKKLRFDFAVFVDGKIKLIELQGDQHFNKNNYWYTEEAVARDKIKKNYCQKNHIPFLEVFLKENYIEKVNAFLKE